MDINPDEFLAGQIACQNGDKATGLESDSWTRGYGTEYEKEQVMTELREKS